MMTLPPVSHDADPDTAKLAAAIITDDGQRQNQIDRIYRVVRDHPNQTAKEIAAYCELEHVAAQRRLSDLLNMGIIEMGDKAQPPGHQLAMVTWHVAYKGPVQGTLL